MENKYVLQQEEDNNNNNNNLLNKPFTKTEFRRSLKEKKMSAPGKDQNCYIMLIEMNHRRIYCLNYMIKYIYIYVFIFYVFILFSIIC